MLLFHACVGQVDTMWPVTQKPEPTDGQEHVSFHISPLNKHTKPESRQNSIPLNLSVYITDKEAARQPPTQSQGQATQHTFDCGEQTGERGDLYFTKRAPALRAWRK